MLDASKQKSEGSGIWRSPHFVLHMAPLASVATLKPAVGSQAGPTTVIGVICPKRWAKRAVTRNTLKRQIYAVTREYHSQLPSACLVLRLAAGFSREEFTSATSPRLKRAARQEIQGLLSKLPRHLSHKVAA